MKNRAFGRQAIANPLPRSWLSRYVFFNIFRDYSNRASGLRAIMQPAAMDTVLLMVLCGERLGVWQFQDTPGHRLIVDSAHKAKSKSKERQRLNSFKRFQS